MRSVAALGNDLRLSGGNLRRGGRIGPGRAGAGDGIEASAGLASTRDAGGLLGLALVRARVDQQAHDVAKAVGAWSWAGLSPEHRQEWNGAIQRLV